MSDNIQRSRGRPNTYKFDRGGTPTEFGPYIGVVKNNIDPVRSGRLEVYIEQFGGSDPDDRSLWRTVNYVPPFYGVTPRNNATSSAGDGSFKGNQHSYGMWFTPPDIGVQVICFFVSGDPNQGYYIGCVPDPGVTHMIPAIGSTSAFIDQNEAQKQTTEAAGAKQLPVVEINQENPGVYEDPRFWTQPKPVHSWVYSTLLNQGLLGDPVRGPITSSAQRESPSTVYGISTPGRPIYQGGISDADIKKKLEAGEIEASELNIEGRRGGHSFVMDDGDIRGRDNLIRIRSAKGHQITMSDEADCFYIVHGNGLTWIELNTEGAIDVFSTNSVNVRSKGEINLHADKNININAGENLNIRAGNIQIESNVGTTSINSTKELIMASQTSIGVVSDGPMTLNSDTGGWKCSSGLVLKGSRIDLNSGSPPKVTPPKPIKSYKLPDVSLVDGQGWQEEPDKIESIVLRAPTHEPYPYHNKGVPVKITVAASTPAAPSPQVAQALAQTQNLPVNAPVTPATPLSGTQAVAQARSLASGAVPALSKGVPPGVVAGVNAAQIMKTPLSTTTLGALNKTSVTGLVAQAKSAVGQASNVISVDKGIGEFGFKPEQLETAGFLKPGTLSTIKSKAPAAITEADIQEALRLNTATGGSITAEQIAQNRQINSILSSPTVWSGKEGIGNLNTLLGNQKLQGKVQEGLLSSSFEGLKTAGIITGKESADTLSGLVQGAAVSGVGAVNDFVKGRATPDVTGQISATIKGANFSTNFVNSDKLGSFAGAPKIPNVAELTVDRTAVDSSVASALGDTQVEAPTYTPQVREPEEPTEIDTLGEEARAIVLESVEFLDKIKVGFDELIEESKVLDAQQPLTNAQIDAFAAKRDEIRAIFNGSWKSVYVPKIKGLEDSKYDPIRSYVNSATASIARLVGFLASISAAQKELIELWREKAVTNT